MDYEDLKRVNTQIMSHFKLCHHVSENLQERHTEKAQTYKRKNDVLNFKDYFLKE
jgi:hypothetical protein